MLDRGRSGNGGVGTRGVKKGGSGAMCDGEGGGVAIGGVSALAVDAASCAVRRKEGGGRGEERG
eukprot:757422-Hanusia_phi.AAC.2